MLCHGTVTRKGGPALVEWAGWCITLQKATNKAPEGKAVGPGLLLQVHEHLLLQLVLPVGDCDAVVVPAASTFPDL